MAPCTAGLSIVRRPPAASDLGAAMPEQRPRPPPQRAAALRAAPAAAAGRDRGAVGRRLRHGLAPPALVRDAGAPSRGHATPSSPHHRVDRDRRLCRDLCGGGRALAAGRRRAHDHRRLPVRRLVGGAGGVVGCDHRRHHHLPDRQERVRRAPRAARRSAGRQARRRLSRRRVQLPAVPAAGAVFPFWLVNLVPALVGVRLRPSSPRPRSASSRRLSRLRSSAPGSTA